MSEKQIKVKFVTKEDSLQVEDSAVYVPVSLKRFGLSEIVNYLLVQQKKINDDKPIPFDFLVNDNILSGSLDEYLTEKGISSEVLLTVEYKRAVLPPTFLSSFNNDDWISSVQLKDSQILTGSYDGVVRTWDMSGNVTKQMAGHSGAVKSVAWISDTRLVSGSLDRQLRLWAMKEKSEQGKTVAILEGHKAGVNSVAVNGDRILSGGSDNDIYLWSTNEKDMEPITIEHDKMNNNLTSTAAQKRRKLAIKDETVKRRSPLLRLDSHKSPVQSVVFKNQDPTVGYSVSMDHTVKTWDLVTGNCVTTAATSFSLLSMCEMPEIGVLAMGSSARHIMLHDPRVGSKDSIVYKQLVGHKGFVVSLAKNPKNSHLFASGSYDGTVKIWDLRSDKAMYTLAQEEKEKILSVAWGDVIVSGGESKKLDIYEGVSV